MYHVYIWSAGEYKYVETVSAEVLKNLLADSVCETEDICYIAW